MLSVRDMQTLENEHLWQSNSYGLFSCVDRKYQDAFLVLTLSVLQILLIKGNCIQVAVVCRVTQIWFLTTESVHLSSLLMDPY